MPESIVVPLIDREFDLLKTWLRYMPRSGVTAGRLFLSIDGKWPADRMATLRGVFRRSELAAEKWTLEFLDCELTRAESFYLRGNASTVDLAQFPYGTKSGPNQQFFRTMRLLRQQGVSAACLLLEVDAFPTRPGWLAELAAALRNMDFLIAGSAYAGQSRLAPEIRRHYNGNSVYNLGHAAFDQFLATWDRLLIHCLNYMPSLAYDIVLEWFRNRRLACGEAASTDTGFAQLLLHYSQLAHDLRGLIVNYGGAFESRPNYTFDADNFAAAFPEARVVHGKCFIDAIYRLRAYYRNPNSPPFRYPTNLAMAALQRGEVDQALLSGKLGADLCEVMSDSPVLLEKAQRDLLGTLIMGAA